MRKSWRLRGAPDDKTFDTSPLPLPGNKFAGISNHVSKLNSCSVYQSFTNQADLQEEREVAIDRLISLADLLRKYGYDNSPRQTLEKSDLPTIKSIDWPEQPADVESDYEPPADAKPWQGTETKSPRKRKADKMKDQDGAGSGDENKKKSPKKAKGSAKTKAKPKDKPKSPRRSARNTRGGKTSG